MEREYLLEDVESEWERESIVTNQERDLEELQVVEESQMEEDWEIARNNILTSFHRRRSDLQSSLASVNSKFWMNSDWKTLELFVSRQDLRK